MSGSVVALVNRALRYLGHPPITAMDDGSAAANIASDLWPGTRDSVLRMHAWNCATFLAVLPALADDPAWGWEKQFSLPSGPEPPFCLRVLRVKGDVSHAIHWRVHGRRIVADTAGPLSIEYIGRVADPGAYDPLLFDAIAIRLAHDMAPALVANTQVQDTLRSMFAAILEEARRVDGREQSQDERVVSTSWVGARYGRGGRPVGGGPPY